MADGHWAVVQTNRLKYGSADAIGRFQPTLPTTHKLLLHPDYLSLDQITAPFYCIVSPCGDQKGFLILVLLFVTTLRLQGLELLDNRIYTFTDHSIKYNNNNSQFN